MKITIDELMLKLADIEVSESELGQYFEVDKQNSKPFSPRFCLNAHTVSVPSGTEGETRSALALNSANFFARVRRRMRFDKRVTSRYKGPVIVSEGDSWFQYPFLLHDTIDYLMEEYAVLSLGAAGDLLQNIARERQYIQALKDTGASLLLLSAGGNDLVAGGALADHIDTFDEHLEPSDYLLPSFQNVLDNAIAHYERILRDVHGAFPHVQVLCHGYDYPLPDRGPWLGRPFEQRQIADIALQRSIAREMMNRFNRGLLKLCASMPHATYVDCRNTVGEHRWYDELHPDNAGYHDVANRFTTEIESFLNGRSTAQVIFSGPFGNAGAARRAGSILRTANSALEPQCGRGLSLHIGINSVDPGHYAGWDGRLRACENDALAMAALAEAQRFETETLLTRAATRDAVVDRIRQAAERLDAGDMFLLSISAHGGKLPDLNQDEIDDGDDPLDETLLLYDFMIADDELFALWSEFKAGVRVLMVADTCHSGSMIRANPFDMMWLGGGQTALPDGETRAAPRQITSRTFFQNREAYTQRASHFAHIREEIVQNPLTTPVRASVMSLGACRDDQFARDGTEFGAFTGALLKCWNKGRFSGTYHNLIKEITRQIDRPDQIPKIKQVGARDPAFPLQQPFSVWTRPSPGSVSATGIPTPPPGPVHSEPQDELAASSAVDYLTAEEGADEDPLSDDDIDALFERKAGNIGSRSAAAAAAWPLYGRFREFVAALSLAHFSAEELLILGNAHQATGSRCGGKNRFPDEALWPNIIATVRVLDTLRARLGRSIAISNAYRYPDYNRCIGGVASSQHTRYSALDFVVRGMQPVDCAGELRRMRDTDRLFHGGIGLYSRFVHLDTRGVNATWPASFV